MDSKSALAEHKDLFIIHFSTDYVLMGERGYIKEDNATNPLNHYAESKLAEKKFSVIQTVVILLLESPGCLVLLGATLLKRF